MPRPKKPPRLILRDGQWIIRDGQRYVRTGCAEPFAGLAHEALAAYVTAKAAGAEGKRGSDQTLLIADVLRIYINEHGPTVADPALLYRMTKGLIPYWAMRPVADIKGATCREYVQVRGSSSLARRELECLRAAINHYHREYGLNPKPAVTLPPKPRPRDGWLTRSEAARLLRAARGTHLARFILIALYTGTRSKAILALRWTPSTTGGWVDLDKGLLYRASASARVTRKRQPTARIPDKLLGHLRRWARTDHPSTTVVHWQGKQVASIRKAFKQARDKANLPDTIIPHTLRHTAVTWAMQAGIDRWQAAGYFGLTMETLEQTYGHHHPDFQKEMNRAF